VPKENIFSSFWIGGLECSSHRLGSGKRLDMLAAIGHDQFYEADYLRLRAHGITTIRSGLRWHRIEPTPGRYDFSSVLSMLRAARTHGVQIIWDLCHYGWPDDIDLFTPTFVRRFARLAGAFARLLADETDAVQFVAPINEISFFSWGAGDAGYLNPFQNGRGFELKVQLARAAIEGIEAVWDVLPGTRIVHVDPVIHIATDPARPGDHPWAEGHRMAQFQAWDMLSGRSWPQVGGAEKYLDLIGCNYYSNNQWIHGGPTLRPEHPLYRPFRHLLNEVYERYHRPIFIGETGAEDDYRVDWIRYIGSEVAATVEMGIPVEGVCLYPIFNHPGWDNERHCHNGLWDYLDADGGRAIYEPLAAEIRVQDSAIRAVQSVQDAQTAVRAARFARVVAGREQAHICLFTDSLEASGMGEHMLQLAGALCAAHRVTLIMPATAHNQGILDRARLLPIHVTALEVRGQNRQSWEALRSLLRDNDVDIFHQHAGITWEGFDGFFSALFADVPVLLRTEHLPYKITNVGEKVVYTRLLHELHGVICVSEEARESFRAAGVPDAKLAVVRNGIPPAQPTRERALVRAELQLPARARVILTAGRMTEQKGYHHLLDAIPAVIAACPEARFVWAGDGPLATDLSSEIERRGLSDVVQPLGWRSDVRDLLAAADLFVLPSLFEGLPLVVLEALAAGTPIVATRVGGIPEAITDGVQGRLVAPADSAALASAIIEALTQPEQTARRVAAGRARFAAAFGVERMARETETVYRHLLDTISAKHTELTPTLYTNGVVHG